MSRRTRKQYAERLARVHEPKHSFPEALEMLKREIKRRAVADGVIVDPSTDRPRYDWHYEVVSLEHSIAASGVIEGGTKSEARAIVKRDLGLKRLPVGSTFIRVDPYANCESAPNPLA